MSCVCFSKEGIMCNVYKPIDIRNSIEKARLYFCLIIVSSWMYPNHLFAIAYSYATQSGILMKPSRDGWMDGCGVVG